MQSTFLPQVPQSKTAPNARNPYGISFDGLFYFGSAMVPHYRKNPVAAGPINPALKAPLNQY